MAAANKKQGTEESTSDWASPRGASNPEKIAEAPVKDNERTERLDPEEAEAPDEATPEVETPPAEAPPETPVLTAAPAPVPRSKSPVAPIARFKTRFSSLPGKQKQTVGLIALVIILVLIGMAAYFGFVSASPDKILQEALTNTINQSKLKSAAFDGSLQLSGKNIPKTFTGVDFSGVVAENGDFSLTAQADLTVTKVSLDVRRVGTTNLYLRLGGLTGVSNVLSAFSGANPQAASLSASLGPILGQLNNQWYQVDTSALSQFAGGATSITSAGQLSQKDSQKFAEAYQNNPFLYVTKRQSDEKVNGMSSYHFTVGIDKDQLKAFLQAIKDDNLASLKSSGAQLNQILSNLDKADLSKTAFDVWIAKGSKFIDQVAVTDTGSGGTTAHLQLSLKDFNKAQSVEQPSGAKSFQDLVQLILPAFLGGSAGQL